MVVQPCLNLCNPMDWNTPGFPVLHYLLEFAHSCPLSQWCRSTISSSAIPFSSCLQSFPASRSFPTSWLLASGGQSIGASTSASVLSMNIQGWFPLGLTGLTSLQSKGLSRVFSSNTLLIFRVQPSSWPNSHIHTWLLEKIIALIIWIFVSSVMSLHFSILSSFVIAFFWGTRIF